MSASGSNPRSHCRGGHRAKEMFNPLNLKPLNETFALAFMAGVVIKGVIWFGLVRFHENLNPNETNSV